MSAVYPLQANMTRGEVTPLMHARGDTEFYAAGLAEARNVVVSRYGGVIRAPGSIYRGLTKTQAKLARWIRFEFNRTQVYAIEAGDLYFRFWADGGRIESAGVPVEVTTPYAEADLKYLRVRQSGDVLYIWCRKAAGGAYQPRTLTRNSETSWTLAVWTPEDGPFLREDTNGVTLTPAGTGHITPDMTSNSAPSGTVSSSGGGADVWKVFDRDKETFPILDTTANGYVQYRFPGGAKKVADAYWLTSEIRNSDYNDFPINFQFQGSNDGSNWITLDSRTGQSNLTNQETRYYDFPNSDAYEYYRLAFQGGGGPDATNTTIGEFAIHQKASDQTPFNLVASAVTGINGGSGFVASDVGRVIRLLGSDGRWRVATIAARTNSTTVTIRLGGHALPDTSPISRWQLGTFSDESGWPYTGAIYEDRLVHAGTSDDPLGVWMSVSADYDSFLSSVPMADDDGISVRLTGGKLNEISWLQEAGDLIAGTAGSLRAIGRNNQNAALSPSNVRQKTETIAPSSVAEPVEIENVILFMDYYEQRLYEASYTYEVEGYLAREASVLNEHLFALGVVEIAYLSHPHKIVVGRRTDGKLVFFTYDREQKVAGATLVEFTGGEVEAIMDLPGASMTDLWMVVKRTVNGSTVRYVETLAEFWRSDTTVQDLPIYFSSAATYDGVAVTSILTADPLKAKTVGIWADGRDIGDATVDANGDFTLPGGVSAEQIVYGIRMPWSIETLRLTQIGNRDGSGLGRSVNIISGALDLYESAGVSVGSVDVQYDMGFEDELEADPDAPVTLRTGMFDTKVDDSWRNNGVLRIEGDRGYPVTVRAIQLMVDGEP